MEKIKQGIIIIVGLIIIYIVGMFLLAVLGMIFSLVFTVGIIGAIGFVIYKMFDRNKVKNPKIINKK